MSGLERSIRGSATTVGGKDVHIVSAPHDCAAKPQNAGQATQLFMDGSRISTKQSNQCNPSSHHGTATLLELPAEVRLEIFGYFRNLPEEIATGHDEITRTRQMQARAALRLVCKQISSEWSPIFFATTTVVLNVCKNRTLERVESTFLAQPIADRLANLRKLSYEVSTTEHHLVSLGISQTRKLFLLAGILSTHKALFASLGEVLLSARALPVFLRTKNLLHTEDGEFWNHLWRTTSDNLRGGHWWDIYVRFREQLPSNTPEPWSVIRKMQYETTDETTLFFPSYRRRTYRVDVVQLVFRKPPMSTLTSTALDGWVELPWEDATIE